MKILLSVFLILLTNYLSAEEIVKVTNFRKGVKVIIGKEIISPKIDDEIPFNAKIESDKMGSLELEYKGNIYKIRQNTSIFVWEVIKAGGTQSLTPEVKSSPIAVRALKPKKNTKANNHSAKKVNKKKKKLVKD